MKKRRLNCDEVFLQFLALIITAIIVTSSIGMTHSMVAESTSEESEPSYSTLPFHSQPCKVSAINAEEGLWISFDSSGPGSQAEAHATISDTTGITIVADFHGFWKWNSTVDGTEYDVLEMPGASSIQWEGVPSLPCLIEYVEIPYDVDVTIEVLFSSNDTTSGYNIIPAPPLNFHDYASEFSTDILPNSTSPLYEGPIYSNNTFFPGMTTSMQGDTNATSMIMRGHRLLGLNFYPVQYNPVNTTMLVYSQIVIKVKYGISAQIRPVPERLQSIEFEKILSKIILNYPWCHRVYQPPIGIGPVVILPNIMGAEYLIITTNEFKQQADRLAEWKERKGLRSYVWIVEKGSREAVRSAVEIAYRAWIPVPTYVLLLGDVEYIPANYDQKLKRSLSNGNDAALISERDCGNVASDLGYFNIEGNDYLPDFIYGRISVDTPEQAEIVINKTLQYEQNPPLTESFYNSILSAGYFQDTSPRDGMEDLGGPFIYTLESIRHYLKDVCGYDVHINYSAAWTKQKPLSFNFWIAGLSHVSDSLPPGHVWIGGYIDQPYLDRAKRNITLNINAGRFLVLCYGHGGSKNLIYPFNVKDPPGYDRNDRDDVEGFLYPFFNTSYFADLTNGDMTPLVVMVACSAGWYDGETDETVMELTTLGNPNPFSDYKNECFAENITRLEGGGAIAAIASSRPSFAAIGRHLMNGIVEAFWPGYLATANQPIYEMGAALLFAKMNALSSWPWCPHDLAVAAGLIGADVEQTTFEEYNLFGDPELQLWTDVPSNFSVSYPVSVGTSNPQRFVVTVKNSNTGELVNFAKVCIQQKNSLGYSPVYQVGYTNERGQAIFDINPTSTPSHINVTVTKHNFRPHIGSMAVHMSNAKVILSQDFGSDDEQITIGFADFPSSKPISVYIDEHVVVSNLPSGTTEYHWIMPSGPTKFMNVWVAVPDGNKAQWNPVSVERVGRNSLAEGPDPYIYTQYDPTTLDSTGGVFSWDNPDIVVFGNRVTVFVHNRGASSSIGTQVTLSYSPHFGGLTWYEIGTKSLSGADGSISFDFSPIPQSNPLRVDLFHEDESLENSFNNIGYDITGIIEMSSPGIGNFLIGNPSCSRRYVAVNVRQLGNYSDVWSGIIQGYSSQAMNPGLTEDVSLIINSPSDTAVGDSRLFEVEIFTDCAHIYGILFNATRIIPPLFPPIDLTLVLGIGIGVGLSVAVIVIWKVRKR